MDLAKTSGDQANHTPGNTTPYTQLILLLHLRQLHVRPPPKMAQVADGQVDREPHLGRHHDEDHVPAQARHNEQQRAPRLRTKEQLASS